MPQDMKILLPIVLALFIIWLVFRMKRRIPFIVRNEVYNHFPSIKETITSFEQRIEYLKIQLEVLERKMNELEHRMKK